MTTPIPSAPAALPVRPVASTTRVCIKNLPPSFDEARLKQHIQQQQQHLRVTDSRILKTKDGHSRRIAFVGFQTSDQAKTAVEYFDRTFAGTSRLSVSLAFSKKGPPGEGYRPWSRHSVGSSRYEKLHQQLEGRQREAAEENNESKNQGNSADKDAESEEIKRKRDEFLSAMGMTSKKGNHDDIVSKSKFWANDDVVVEPGGVKPTNSNGDGPESTNGSEGGDDDGDHNDSNSSDGSSGVADNADLDFLRSKQVKADILTDDESDNEAKGDDGSSASCSESVNSLRDSVISTDEDDLTKQKEGQHAQQSNNSDVAEASSEIDEKKEAQNVQNSKEVIDRLFVRNLPFTTTEEELFEVFSQFGAVPSVHIPVDDSKRNKGYAFVTFQQRRDANLAMKAMDGEDFQGRLIHILPARPSAVNDPDTSNLTYKERQALARQKEAEKSSRGGSASFLRGDAVVDNVADRLGMSKGDVLNVKNGISSGNAAVRLALGETHIISENIAFFEEHGVDVKALDSTMQKGRNSSGDTPSQPKRSRTMILVKNLPYDTSKDDLMKVFHSIGGDAPRRLLLPPSKTAALVEYGHVTDARRAFRRLAYKKFKHVPLYLEWAPMQAEGIRGAKREGVAANSIAEQGSSDTVVKQGLTDDDPSSENSDIGVSQTIYVKNLNFSTSEDELNMAFAKAGFHPRAVKIPTKASPIKKSKKSPSSATDTKSNTEMRPFSMGYGFVEFPSEQEAVKAMKALQGKLVDGHALEIKLSTKNLSSSKALVAADKSSKNTKIMVRNVPFEATRTELLHLFGSFGQLKKVRLPKKFDGTHRGFAFCEFMTSKEAQNAMTTLSRTHLYGRHLVLEWAAAAENDGKIEHVGMARERAKRDAMKAGVGGAKGSRKKGKHLKF